MWDRESGLSHNSPVALLRFPVDQARFTTAEDPPAPMPTWMKLLDINGEEIRTSSNAHAEILVSFQVIRKKDPNIRLGPPPDITPQYRKAWLEITAVGLRNMKPFNYRAITAPYVHFNVCSATQNYFFQTPPNRLPTGQDSNILKRYDRT